ncbi:hypothetical protein BCR43DRAFT_62358 [Syncephalastrum racemosum]|uniref:Armadillo-type protein n=1 Tax=Syncephalastrum racemosum TaxID=13706 RepID=A0A1X2HWA4_SYNRA|nr:hypothetical protein BCR43DRAFT_62358 [Syncephalastrum racemosum]
MSVFNTTGTGLLHPIEPDFLRKRVSEREIERLTNAIVDKYELVIQTILANIRAHDHCRGTPRPTPESDQLDAYLVDLLLEGLDFEDKVQLIILSELHQMLVATDPPEAAPVKGYLARLMVAQEGWTLLARVDAYLPSHNDEVREKAAHIFERIAELSKPAEVWLLALEQIPMMNWREAYPDVNKCACLTLRLSQWFKIFGKALERNQGREPIQDILYIVRHLDKALYWVKKITMEKMSQAPKEEQQAWSSMVFIMTNTVLDFVTFCSSQSEGFRDKTPEKIVQQNYQQYWRNITDYKASLWFLAAHLVTFVCDRVILNLDLRLCAIYALLYPSKYKSMLTDEELEEVLNIFRKGTEDHRALLVNRITQLVQTLGVTFDVVARIR